MRQHRPAPLPDVDDYVTGQIIWYLSEHASTLLVPPAPGPGLDPAALRAELRRLAERGQKMMAMLADGDLEPADVAQGKRHIRKLVEDVEAKLAVTARTDPLAEFRDRPADAVWDSLPLARKRAVIRLITKSVTLLPVGKGNGRQFRPESVDVAWKDPTPEHGLAARGARPGRPHEAGLG